MCPICRGRGEVEAGITGGFVQTGTVVNSVTGLVEPLGHPTWVKPNPHAIVNVQTGNVRTDYKDIAIIQENPLVELWGIAVCGKCHGTGRLSDEIDSHV